MVIKTGRYGEFLSCTRLPECKNAQPVPLGVPCPKCGGDIIEIRSKKRGAQALLRLLELPASCDFKLWQKPVDEPCPQCKHPFLVHGGGQKNPSSCVRAGKECGYSRPLEDGARRGRGAPGRRVFAGSASDAAPRPPSESSSPAAPRMTRARRSPSSAPASPAARPRSQLAERGIRVRLLEQKPQPRTPAQIERSALRARVLELVSRRGARQRRRPARRKRCGGSGSFVMRAAEQTRVPGGRRARRRSRALLGADDASGCATHPRIEVESARGRAHSRASGRSSSRPGRSPATRSRSDIARAVGQRALAYYDAIAPIVSADSIDWIEGVSRVALGQGRDRRGSHGLRELPVRREQYSASSRTLASATKVEPKSVRGGALLRGLPADRGDGRARRDDARVRADEAGGPHRSAAPGAGRTPWCSSAPRTRRATAYNLVGFQTRMRGASRQRVFRTIPGLEEAEFFAYGAVHRNTFLNAPSCSTSTLAAARAIAGRLLRGSDQRASRATSRARRAAARARASSPSALRDASRRCRRRRRARRPHRAALARNPGDYQPSNITFSHLAPYEGEAPQEAREVRGDGRTRASRPRRLAGSPRWGRGPTDKPGCGPTDKPRCGPTDQHEDDCSSAERVVPA